LIIYTASPSSSSIAAGMIAVLFLVPTLVFLIMGFCGECLPRLEFKYYEKI
jgi:hypothetical protein